MGFELKESYRIEDLLEIMRILRSENGCPWDKIQTHQSIRRDFVEETYEAIEAIDREDPVMLEEELGDVLLQVVFHARIEEEKDVFSFDDVCDGVCKKLILRHPHIFGDVTADTPEEVLKNWDAIKKQEKGQETYSDTLSAVAKTLPALMRSAKVQKRAGRAGFDYADTAEAMADLQSELSELQEAISGGDADAVDEEFGDLLFSCVNVSRFLHVDAEESLVRSTEKFIRRFTELERLANAAGIRMQEASMTTLNELWKEAKKHVHS